MVRNTLEHTQLQAGTLSILPQAVDCPDILTSAVERVRTAAQAKRQRLEVALPPDLPQAWADPDRVAQVLVELLDNAVKFGPEAGRIAVCAWSDARRVVFEVADDGQGMNVEVLERLFRPFYQADGSSTRRHGGLGLGLALAHQLATALHGRLEARSTIGKGTTFTFELPRAAPA